MERTSDQREAVAGGGCGDIYDCPRCDKHVTDFTHYDQNGDKSKKITKGKCSNCGYEFEVVW